MSTAQFYKKTIKMARQNGVIETWLKWGVLCDNTTRMWEVLHAIYRSRGFGRVTRIGDRTCIARKR